MPFIEEENLTLMQEDLDNARLKRENAEDELGEIQEKLTSFQKKSRITAILLGLLLGISLGACYYFYTSATQAPTFSEADITAIKSKENTRVLDSINIATIAAMSLDNTQNESSDSRIGSGNLDEVVNEVKNNTTGETIYSVQVGVFYNKKKFPLLSSKTIPAIITSEDDYFKYSLGLFTTLSQAKKFKKELIKLGFKDAFVASYIDGKRQKIHD
ncbi:SPOR domain-containing protein [Tenacibaculum finnmarkense]|uniref:SPOR domain-containing protein n=1 Tax=Tenacibaculum finnmarkense TaxID=2781243 RepID=UPI001E3D0A68|nr:SPOR domain-containing protein [Tenacibaculum finnmarkense]MCD8412125.1 SPOR domain-containing protein [Tenacibaculum finnmarkense genomovar ulcerans]MCG8207965.1 hypothetical protein [Tenacibaculum finnmarkense genomovar finnmarkense]MCG8723976.1 hypothetical protein [Tenacibaculum finnmarkense]MCG8742295.1 hypothetical protein [Tenacibaculum finnmarkense]MCG8765688.1 hypothetical protein [Tenacibaculum finnmarkense]